MITRTHARRRIPVSAILAAFVGGAMVVVGVSQNAVAGQHASGHDAGGTVHAPAKLDRCNAGDLRISASRTVYDHRGALRIEIASSRWCVLHGVWPQVDLIDRSGHRHFAKGYPYLSAVLDSFGGSAAAPKPDGTINFTVRPGSPREVDVVSTGTSGCFRLQRITYYTTIFGGAKDSLKMKRPVTLCGQVFELPLMPGETRRVDTRMAQTATTFAAHAAAKPLSRRSTPNAIIPYDDSAGFFYGVDTNLPTLCHSTKYYVPKDGDTSCGSGNLGEAGIYAGAVGGWEDLYGCGTQVQWITATANHVNTNLTSYGDGVGAAGFYHAGGAQRDVNYDGSGSEATEFGKVEAANASGLGSNYPIYSPFIFVDIESSAGYTNDSNGWNSGGFSTKCDMTPSNDTTHHDLNFDVVTGFGTWLQNNTSYLRGYYSSGGSAADGPNTWRNIMGPDNNVTATSEWTFEPNTGDRSTGLTGFTQGSQSAQWFGQAPSDCHLMWQFSSGGSKGDYDQLDYNDALDPCSL